MSSRMRRRRVRITALSRIVDAQDASGKQRQGRGKEEAFAAGRLSGREEARIASVLKGYGM